jgi:hypothetical protein
VLSRDNNEVSFGLLWDVNYLYVGVRVADSVLRNDSDVIWQDDSIEIYLDGNRDGSAAYDAFDRQFIIGWNHPQLFEKEDRTDGVQHAVSAVRGGFTCEIAIPWSHLGVAAQPGLWIGFDLANNDDDNGGDRDGQLMWSGSALNHSKTSGFGDCQLRSFSPGTTRTTETHQR